MLTRSEWLSLGVSLPAGWEHYMVHEPEPHVLCFRRPLPRVVVEYRDAATQTMPVTVDAVDVEVQTSYDVEVPEVAMGTTFHGEEEGEDEYEEESEVECKEESEEEGEEGEEESEEEDWDEEDEDKTLGEEGCAMKPSGVQDFELVCHLGTSNDVICIIAG